MGGQISTVSKACRDFVAQETQWNDLRVAKGTPSAVELDQAWEGIPALVANKRAEEADIAAVDKMLYDEFLTACESLTRSALGPASNISQYSPVVSWNPQRKTVYAFGVYSKVIDFPVTTNEQLERAIISTLNVICGSRAEGNMACSPSSGRRTLADGIRLVPGCTHTYHNYFNDHLTSRFVFQRVDVTHSLLKLLQGDPGNWASVGTMHTMVFDIDSLVVRSTASEGRRSLQCAPRVMMYNAGGHFFLVREIFPYDSTIHNKAFGGCQVHIRGADGPPGTTSAVTPNITPGCVHVVGVDGHHYIIQNRFLFTTVGEKSSVLSAFNTSDVLVAAFPAVVGILSRWETDPSLMLKRGLALLMEAESDNPVAQLFRVVASSKEPASPTTTEATMSLVAAVVRQVCQLCGIAYKTGELDKFGPHCFVLDNSEGQIYSSMQTSRKNLTGTSCDGSGTVVVSVPELVECASVLAAVGHEREVEELSTKIVKAAVKVPHVDAVQGILWLLQLTEAMKVSPRLRSRREEVVAIAVTQVERLVMTKANKHGFSDRYLDFFKGALDVVVAEHLGDTVVLEYSY